MRESDHRPDHQLHPEMDPQPIRLAFTMIDNLSEVSLITKDAFEPSCRSR